MIQNEHIRAHACESTRVNSDAKHMYMQVYAPVLYHTLTHNLCVDSISKTSVARWMTIDQNPDLKLTTFLCNLPSFGIMLLAVENKLIDIFFLGQTSIL